MAATPLTLMEPTAATAETAAAPATARPTQLFASDALTTSANANNTANAGAVAAAATSPIGGGSSNSAATSPSFLPEMPQWKKDLIQRRKTNVARTIGAAAVTPTTPTTPTAAETPQQQQQHLTLSDQQQLAAQQAETTATAAAHEHATEAADGLQALAKDFTLKSTTVFQQQTTSTTKAAKTLTTTKASKYTASQQQHQQQHQLQQQHAKSNLAKMPMPAATITNSPTRSSPTKEKTERMLGGHYTPLANEECDRKDWSQSQQQSATSPTTQSPTKASAVPIPKQRSLFLPTKSYQIKEQQQQQELDCTSPTTAGSSSLAAAAHSKSHNNGVFHASEKRMNNNAAATTTRLASSSALRETFGVADEAVMEVQETETTRKPYISGKSGTYAAAQRSQMQSTATTTTTGTAQAMATTLTGALTPLSTSSSQSQLSALPLAQQQQQKPQPHQFHSKYESERTLSGTSAHTHVERLATHNTTASTPIIAAEASCDKPTIVYASPAPSGSFMCVLTTGNSGKIFSKLQNNQFIKQEQQQQQQQLQQQLSGTSCTQTQGTARYLKHKSHSLQESSGYTNLPTAVTGSGSVSSSGSVSGSVSSSGAGSPTKTTSSTAPTACAIKKKMVAVQEMKKTTQNTNHHHRGHHLHQPQHIIGGGTTCARPARPRTPSQTQSHNEEVDFDPSEDLSYGPGIVSKLRCRYLSLAYRESMEKERLCLDNMRRATSLNNLLDRDDHKDEHEADEDDIEDDEEDEYVELRTDNERSTPEGGKLKPAVGGILKHSHDAGAENAVHASKKTATFQKHAVRNNAGTTNGTLMSQSQHGILSQKAGGEKSTDLPRSRHLKRGNDSLKRARSVEALLCERSPWNYALNRTGYEACKTPPLTPTCVTIEDKINNARGRLIMGTDAMPPRRLTSVIDDTERPPPDLVKQTLKKFEATANRRGRGLNRANGKGEVASKVASYKTIIMEHKPPLVFPKPPLSPTKKMISPHIKPVAKPVVAAADLLSSPLGRKTTSAGAHNTSNSSTAKATTSNVATVAGVVSGGLSEHSPDIIPRYKLLAEKGEATSTAVVDSPVSALTKKLEKLRIDADKQSSSGGSANVTTKESQTKQQLSKLPAEAASHDHEVNNKFVGGADSGVGDDNSGDGGDAASTSASVVSDKKKKYNDRASAGATMSSDIGVSVELDTVQAGTGAISSDFSDDENGSLGPTKRVTKTALDNIARAGTTQQFKFAGQSSKTSHISNGSAAQPHPQQQQQQQQQNTNPDIPTSVLNASPGKQIGVIRPLLTTAQNVQTSGAATTATTTPNYNSGSNSNNQQQQQQHMETLKQHSNYTHNTTHSPHSIYHANSANSTNVAANNSPHTPPPPPPQLTSREIEKNRINEMKKTALTDTTTTAATAAGATVATTATNNGVGGTVAAAAATTSLNTVINTNAPGFKAATSSPLTGSSATANASGFSELDTATASNSPLWALRKKRQTPPVAAAENTTMVFNFSNRKEVPDYIENDGVIFRRKRELPKPNESGFVLLGDLLLETSTDTDYDDFSMCPPSPCDVEFENANIVIDGKSSIRQKSKEATYRVQFNDTLTSTFEYPSEASLIIEHSFSEHYSNSGDLLSAYENLRLEDNIDTPALHHHHVAVDEIIQLPTPPHTSSPATATSSTTNTPTKNILGNLPLGSAPLGFYTPVKAPIDNLFQLGVTRAPNSNGHAYATPTSNGNTGNHNGVSSNSNSSFGSSSIVGITDGLNGVEDEPESLQYIKPANDDLTIAYSEGTQKTDLLY